MENKKQEVYIVIAAYNEERKIINVITSLQQNGYSSIIVVDDGSKDNTGVNAEKVGAIVIRHPINRGQGAALKTGFDFALGQNAQIIVTFDADGQHKAEEISFLTTPIETGEVEVCLGSRFLGKVSNVSWHRKLLLKGGALIMWLFYGIKLTDSHNGFRAFSVQALAKLDLKEDRMEHASEIVEQIGKKQLSYKEIPVTIVYTDYSLQKGQRSSAAFKILWNMIKNKVLR